ncbi:MAG: 30S ribosomal protein S9 [Chloroflexi bacterium]|nr:30S ribosomal protein S9 [Chloroflexota bacterium]
MSRGYSYGTGRRKSAVARVQIYEGNGAVVVNGKPLEDAIDRPTLRAVVLSPLRVTNAATRFSAMVKVLGGGTAGQAGAIRHGLSRALVQADPELRVLLRKAGFLTRDPRVKERKKYGLKRARKAPQYTKR